MWIVVWLAALSAAGGLWHSVAAQQAPEIAGLIQYVRDVVGRNRAVQASDLMARAAAERIAPAGALPDPTIGLGVMSVPVPAFTAEPMTQVPLMLEQRFPGFGKRRAATAVARADSGTAAAGSARVTSRIAAEAGAAWFDLAYARRALEVWGARAALADRAVLAARARYETGAAPQTDLLRARLRRAEIAGEERRLRAERLEAMAHGAALRGGAGDSIVTSLPVPPRLATPMDRLTALLEANNPDLGVVQAELARAVSQADALAIAGRPDFTISVQNGVRFGGRDPFFSALVGVSVPLWSGRKQRPLERAAGLEADATSARYDDLTTRLDGELRAQLAALEALYDRIGLGAEQIVPLADAASASALQRYQVGAVEFSAVLDTQDDRFRAQLGLARLIADYGVARVRLAALLGEEWYR